MDKSKNRANSREKKWKTMCFWGIEIVEKRKGIVEIKNGSFEKWKTSDLNTVFTTS